YGFYTRHLAAGRAGWFLLWFGNRLCGVIRVQVYRKPRSRHADDIVIRDNGVAARSHRLGLALRPQRGFVAELHLLFSRAACSLFRDHWYATRHLSVLSPARIDRHRSFLARLPAARTAS